MAKPRKPVSPEVIAKKRLQELIFYIKSGMCPPHKVAACREQIEELTKKLYS